MLRGMEQSSATPPTVAGPRSVHKKAAVALLVALAVPGASFGAYKLWNRYLNYNFGVVTKDKVYKSGAIKPSRIRDYVEAYKIKTVIDLRDEVSDQYHQEEIAAAVAQIEGTRYVNIRSPQVPKRENLLQFYELLDDPNSYPVLIHCYHGLGRTMLYVAVYRMEYEGWSNDAARSQTRLIVESPIYDSSFAAGEWKGNFLINYKPRSAGKAATVNNID